jgi:hypothetical protein
MKIKQGFLLREVAGSWIVVPLGQRVVEFNGLMSLSESGAFLWKRLEEEVQNEQELVSSITEEYDVDESVAREDIRAFLTSITEKGLIEE